MAKANHILYSKQRSFKKSDYENSNVPTFLKIRLRKKFVSLKNQIMKKVLYHMIVSLKFKKVLYPLKKLDYEKNVVSTLKKVKGKKERVLCCAKEVKMLTHLIKKKNLIKVMRVLEE